MTKVMGNEKILCIYDGSSQDGLLAAAMVKKNWVENQEPLPGEEKKAILETGNKVAGYSGSIKFVAWKKTDILPTFDTFDRIILLNVTFNNDVMKRLYKAFKKRLSWYECDSERLSMIEDTKTEKGSLLNLIDGIRGDIYSVSEMLWIAYNNDLIYTPEFMTMIAQFYCKDHAQLHSRGKVWDFVNSINMRIKSFNDWYEVLWMTKEQQNKFLNI